MSDPTPSQWLTEISEAIRVYLTKETDATRPSFHATAITSQILAERVQERCNAAPDAAKTGVGVPVADIEALADGWDFAARSIDDNNWLPSVGNALRKTRYQCADDLRALTVRAALGDQEATR